MKEYILCSAVWFKDGVNYAHQPVNIKRGFVICGKRHHNCFALLSVFSINGSAKTWKSISQGFLTNTDRFVNRKEAAQIAFESKQINQMKEELLSEDLY